MGLSSSLNAGVMGLAVNATKLATISDNIANSETFGYKRTDTEFTNLVLKQGAGTYNAGGVRSTIVKDIAAQGALVSTSNSTDISIAGRGMIPVTTTAGLNAAAGDRPLLLTTTGSFSPDQNGFLRTEAGNFLMGWAANPDGSITVPGRNSAAGLVPIQISGDQFIASPTSNIELGLNIPASATQAGSDGAAFDLPIEYFDTLGRSQSVSFEFTPQVPGIGASNTWDVNIYDQATNTPGTPIASFNVVFDDAAGTGGSILTVTPGAGATYDATTGLMGVTLTSGPVNIELGTPGSNGPLTQLSSTFAPVGVRADGAPIGNLSAVEINEQGMLEAIYDTGFRRVIFQVPVADVPNMNGLTPRENQTFSVSQASGDFYFWDAGTGPAGQTIGYTLTESTTDIAAELTDLIQTQRAYSSNAKIIQTVDEMLQETTNLIR